VGEIIMINSIAFVAGIAECANIFWRYASI